ncbi:hypothetical protein CDEST_05711 [Colletotrichum destructivum]|uniref:Uncharacterized protein n=1 Tax=Colletotrichum destructivum TaxID=34406 RepID=A0AAX4IBA8_9PEZI|nr:hypothetical protein CDEST_05711 [Colletotrichum destructivum]
MYVAARQSHNPLYVEDLEKRAAVEGICLQDGTSQDPNVKAFTFDMEPSGFFDFYERCEVHYCKYSREGPYWGGMGPDMSRSRVGRLGQHGNPGADALGFAGFR